jgi:hypothetical protein
MMKQYILFFSLIASMILGACSSKSDPSPVSPSPVTPTPVAPTTADLIKKVWSANSVSWDGVVQYTKGGTANLVAGYSQFKLDLSIAGSVTLTEFDGKKFTGSYSLSSDNKKLTLTGLTSSEGAPSGTNGALELTISGNPTAVNLVLETNTTYIKATNKKVALTLVNP